VPFSFLFVVGVFKRACCPSFDKWFPLKGGFAWCLFFSFSRCPPVERSRDGCSDLSSPPLEEVGPPRPGPSFFRLSVALLFVFFPCDIFPSPFLVLRPLGRGFFLRGRFFSTMFAGSNKLFCSLRSARVGVCPLGIVSGALAFDITGVYAHAVPSAFFLTRQQAFCCKNLIRLPCFKDPTPSSLQRPCSYHLPFP